ncbi:hypothetical protein B0H67DRAFT_597425 [Lasiosphaeris hirsuta]|uniref:DUF202 domain-containing protein n=1 Tax=Lasiosphaeris hirsuta TaxID=260670 RepID=A0AA40EAY7_9PEZI|nr:hypothetical protein B0H67DRAFT_597425 [Lasiosphaeris hirsuta]
MASMFAALHPNPEDQLVLRLHRARSVVLTSQELVELRAAQRTFEGAYLRTALGQFSFSLIILKIFNSDFYAIGALFAVYGAAIMLVAIFRRYEGNRQFFDKVESEDESYSESDGAGGTVRSVRRIQVVKKKFRTSGNSVALLVVLSFSSYVTLVVLLWHLT